MRLRSLTFALLLLSAPLAAQQTPPADEPCIFNSCETAFMPSQYKYMAFKLMGMTLDGSWVASHTAEMQEALEDTCRVHARCIATPENPFTFCDEVLAQDALKVCDAKYSKTSDYANWDQCRMYVAAWALAVDQKVPDTWRAAQACAKKRPIREGQRLKGHLVPSRLSTTEMIIATAYAYDADTNVPIYAKVAFDGKPVGSKGDPTAKAGTAYDILYKVEPIREVGEDGRIRLRLPVLTLTAPNYPPIEIPYEAEIPELRAELQTTRPLKKGKNRVVVETVDAKSGKRVTGEVRRGEYVLGSTGVPIEVDVSDPAKLDLFVRTREYADTDVVIAKERRLIEKK